jgi:hypothetical protein
MISPQKRGKPAIDMVISNNDVCPLPVGRHHISKMGFIDSVKIKTEHISEKSVSQGML